MLFGEPTVLQINVFVLYSSDIIMICCHTLRLSAIVILYIMLWSLQLNMVLYYCIFNLLICLQAKRYCKTYC